MIAYLDTSAFVKLLVDEAHSAQVRKIVETSDEVVTHLVAYAEACSAFARFARHQNDPRLFQRLKEGLDQLWPTWSVVMVDERLVRQAGVFAGRYGLRGYDSVHLAAADAVYRLLGSESAFGFLAYDAALQAAAEEAGIPLLN
ncbi:MAG: type II toxin-antitoxin system VapC family toxin [Burkholderiales bacterium]|nr:type II toxin-antitoxin system VapC family toxin [Burkholderiales bacterium]PZN06207.1 MAG: VapC toxin family PIN domain ribonuclease [Pseudomonadota bacterium]